MTLSPTLTRGPSVVVWRVRYQEFQLLFCHKLIPSEVVHTHSFLPQRGALGGTVQSTHPPFDPPAIDPCALENKILSHSEKLLEHMDCFLVHPHRLVGGITHCEYLSCLLAQAIQKCVNLLLFVLCRKMRCHPVLLKASQPPRPFVRFSETVVGVLNGWLPLQHRCHHVQ